MKLFAEIKRLCTIEDLLYYHCHLESRMKTFTLLQADRNLIYDKYLSWDEAAAFALCEMSTRDELTFLLLVLESEGR